MTRHLLATILVLCATFADRIEGGLLPTAEAQGKPARAANLRNQPAQTSQRGDRLVEGAAGYKYLCYLPKGYSDQPKFWPLIVFLHGACRDEDLQKLKRFGPIKFALEHDDFRFIVAAPASARGWSVKELSSFLDRIQTQFRVDRNRIYLTGPSMGGHATWEMAVAYPGRFAAIAPVAGAGNPRLAASRLRRVPVWVFHGEKDDVVPVTFARMMIEAMKGCGGEVKQTLYPDRGHDACPIPYENPELYEWFLRHRR